MSGFAEGGCAGARGSRTSFSSPRWSHWIRFADLADGGGLSRCAGSARVASQGKDALARRAVELRSHPPVGVTGSASRIWRMGGDSNPRYLSVHTLSRRAQSTTLPPILFEEQAFVNEAEGFDNPRDADCLWRRAGSIAFVTCSCGGPVGNKLVSYRGTEG